MTENNKLLTRRQRRLARQAEESRLEAGRATVKAVGATAGKLPRVPEYPQDELYVEPRYEYGVAGGYYALIRGRTGDVSKVTVPTGGAWDLAAKIARYARLSAYKRIRVNSTGLGNYVANALRGEALPSITIDPVPGPNLLSDAEAFPLVSDGDTEQTVPTVGGSMFPIPEKTATELPGLDALESKLEELREDLDYNVGELGEFEESDPNQYYHLSNGIEAKDVAGELVYNAGTAFTYMFRSCRTDGVVKGDPESDINKAIDHLLFELERRGFERKGVAGA